MGTVHDAALAGDSSAIRGLVSQGALINEVRDVNFASACSTALHVASENGNVSCVKELLALGATPALPNLWGHTPAHLAAASGHPDVLTELLVRDDRLLHIMDDVDRTPLHLAAQHSQVECVVALLAAGAHIDPTETLKALGEPVVKQASAIHAAAGAGAVACLKALLEWMGPDGAMLEDAFKRTPLHVAAENGQALAAEVLIEGGALPDAVTVWGAAPIHLAVKHGHMAVLHALIARGVNVLQRDGYGMTPMHLAARYGKAATLPVLQAAGAECNSVAMSGCKQKRLTPLLIALEMGHVDISAALLAAGSSLCGVEDVMGVLSPPALGIVHRHVQCLSLESVRALTKVGASSGMTLGKDLHHGILAMVFGINEASLRLLLNTEAGGLLVPA